MLRSLIIRTNSLQLGIAYVNNANMDKDSPISKPHYDFNSLTRTHKAEIVKRPTG